MTDQHAAIAARIADLERRMLHHMTQCLSGRVGCGAIVALAHARKEWAHNRPECDAVAARDLDRCESYMRHMEGSKP